MTSHRVHLCNICRSSGLSQWQYNARPMSGRFVVSRVFFENVLIGFSWIDANKTCSTRHLPTNIFYSEYSSRTSWMITLRTFTYSILYQNCLCPQSLKILKIFKCSKGCSGVPRKLPSMTQRSLDRSRSRWKPSMCLDHVYTMSVLSQNAESLQTPNICTSIQVYICVYHVFRNHSGAVEHKEFLQQSQRKLI